MRISSVSYVVLVVLVLVLLFSVFTLSGELPPKIGVFLIVLSVAPLLIYYQLLKPKSALEIRGIKVSREGWHGSVGYRIKAEVVCKDQAVRDLAASVDVRSYGERVPLVTLSYNKTRGKGAVSPTIVRWRNAAHAWSKTRDGKDAQKGKWKELLKGDELYLIFPDPAGDGFAIGDRLHWEKQFLKLEPKEKYQVTVKVEGADPEGNLIEARKTATLTA